MGFRLFFERQLEHRYTKYVDRLSNICRRKNLVMNTVGAVGNDTYDIYLITARPQAKRTICIVGTMYGDQKAGVESILEYLEKERFDPDLRLLIFPLLNPHGYVYNQRSNGQNRDINCSFYGKETEESSIFKKVIEKEKVDFLITIYENHSDFFLCRHSDEKEAKFKPLIEIADKFFPKKDEEMEKTKGNLTQPEKKSKINSLENWVRKKGIPSVCLEVPEKFPLKKKTECLVALMLHLTKTLFEKK